MIVIAVGDDKRRYIEIEEMKKNKRIYLGGNKLCQQHFTNQM